MSRNRLKASRPATQRTISPATLNDGFANFVTRMGQGAGNRASAGTFRKQRLGRQYVTLEAAYESNWLAGTVIDAVAEDMTKLGVELTGLDPDESRKIQSALTARGCWQGLCDAIKWGRLYGGAIAYIDIEGQDSATPLNPDTIRRGQFNGLQVLDRHSLSPSLELVQGGPHNGTPEFYDVLPNDMYGIRAMRIHHSRVIRFIGTKLPLRSAMTEQMWGDTVLARAWDRLIGFETSNAALVNLLDRAHLRTVKIEGLRQIFASGDGSPAEANLLRSFDAMRTLQSSEGLTLLDSKDGFETSNYNYSGLPETLLHQLQQIAGAFQIPLVRLLGQSPAGLNATGESDWRNYFDGILARQETDLREGMTRLLRVVFRSTMGQSMGDDIDFKFVSLWQMTPAEKADIANKHVTAVSTAYGDGLIDKATSLRELRNSSEVTGIFGTITDEAIDEAENEPPEAELPPVPAIAQEPVNGNEEAAPPQ